MESESKWYLMLSVIGLVSLTALGYNILFLNSFLLGVVVSPIYLLIVSLLCGNVFFPQHNLRFRVFYGFVIFQCLLVILGTIAYWVHDLSNLSILAILLFLTITLTGMNWRRRPLLSLALKLKEGIGELNLGILDILFLCLIGLCFYFLFAARTGESIPPIWNIVSSNFFICLILATAVLIIKMWLGKSPPSLLLFYTILVVLIPASGFLIILHQPYYTLKGAAPLHYQNMLTQFGTFSPPGVQEAARNIFGKAMLGIGQDIGNVFFIKLFKFSPLIFGLFFTPILFTIMVVFASFDLMRCLAPHRKELALLCSLAFLATQHNIFLFTPPGKNETLALGLLLVSVMLWIKFWHHQGSRAALFTALTFLLGGILVIHEFVGLFALFLAVSAMLLFWLKPFRGNWLRFIPWLGLNISFLFVWVYGYPYLHSLTSYVIGSPAASAISIHQLSLSRFVQTVAPPPWLGEGLGIFPSILFTFINNSVYVSYVLIIVGAIAAFRMRLDKNWLGISLSLITLAFLYFGVVGNFHVASESYRFFYYLNFIAFPLIGVGLYWLASYITRPRAWLYIISEVKERSVSLKPTQLAICGILLSLLFVSSIYAGYPRENSMGYSHHNTDLSYPSDYDVAALNFIKAKEGVNDDFFIVADTATCAAGMVTIGQKVISTAEGYVSVFSFFHSPWGTDDIFKIAWKDPIRYLVEGTEYSNRFAERTYLIFTYRLAMDKLKSLIGTYSSYLGEPVYSIEGRVYVFSYDRDQVAAILSEATEEKFVLFDDEPANEFWEFGLIGKGELDFSLSDNIEIKKYSHCLQITISPGKAERATLYHKWDEPLDFHEARYLMLLVYGTGSEQSFNIAFRSVEPAADNYFIYSITDNFTGWKHLAIPLESFDEGGTPSWQVIKQMLIQFAPGWSPGKIYLDRISLAQKISPKLLYEGKVILLP